MKTTTMTLLLESVHKGYDLIYITKQKGQSTDEHKHGKSDEVVFLISGKLKIITETNKGQQYTFTILLPNNAMFLPHGKFHQVEAIEDSTYIVISKPPVVFKPCNILGLLKCTFKKNTCVQVDNTVV